MSDDEAGPDDDARQRTRDSAEAAARDLARMGIDPQSLGLAGPRAPAGPSPQPVAAPGRQDGVIPIRPDLARPAEPDRAPSPPTESFRPVPVRGAPAAAEPEPSSPAGEVEQMLARTAAARPAPREPGRWARAVVRGVLTPDAAEAAGVERELLTAVRRRQTERRVVAFAAGKGGVGTTTVLGGVAAAFAALRDDRTAVVDAQAGSPPLSRWFGVQEPVSAGALLTSGDERRVPSSSAGLGVVDGAPWEQPLQRRDLSRVLDRVGAEHTFALVDVGRDPGDGAHAALARCDQAVLVTGVGANGVAALETVTTRLRQTNPAAAQRAVVVVVCPYAESYRRAHREITSRVADAPARVVVVPADPHLATGAPFDPERVSAAVREAMLEVAAAVAMSGATGSRPATGSPPAGHRR